MPPIVISAVITDSSTVLLEVAAEPGAALALPRYTFGDEDTIEEALAGHLQRDLGIAVLEQEFLDTVYERPEGAAEVVLNNLQIVTAWDGVPHRAGDGPALIATPLAELGAAGLSPAVLEVLAGALGVPRPSSLSLGTRAAGRVIV